MKVILSKVEFIFVPKLFNIVQELFSEKQFVSLLKLTITKIHLLVAQQKECDDKETKEYLEKAAQQYKVMLGYLLECRNLSTRRP